MGRFNNVYVATRRRLTAGDVQYIFTQNHRTTADLAEELGVSRSTIHSIRVGDTWATYHPEYATRGQEREQAVQLRRVRRQAEPQQQSVPYQQPQQTYYQQPQPAPQQPVSPVSTMRVFGTSPAQSQPATFGPDMSTLLTDAQAALAAMAPSTAQPAVQPTVRVSYDEDGNIIYPQHVEPPIASGEMARLTTPSASEVQMDVNNLLKALS